MNPRPTYIPQSITHHTKKQEENEITLKTNEYIDKLNEFAQAFINIDKALILLRQRFERVDPNNPKSEKNSRYDDALRAEVELYRNSHTYNLNDRTPKFILFINQYQKHIQEYEALLVKIKDFFDSRTIFPDSPTLSFNYVKSKTNEALENKLAKLNQPTYLIDKEKKVKKPEVFNKLQYYPAQQSVFNRHRIEWKTETKKYEAEKAQLEREYESRHLAFLQNVNDISVAHPFGAVLTTLFAPIYLLAKAIDFTILTARTCYLEKEKNSLLNKIVLNAKNEQQKISSMQKKNGNVNLLLLSYFTCTKDLRFFNLPEPMKTIDSHDSTKKIEEGVIPRIYPH